MSAKFNRLVIAAYRLPFKFESDGDGYKAIQNSGGLVSAVLALSESFKQHRSEGDECKIAWAGISEGLPKNITPQDLYNEHFDIIPVHITEETNTLYYGGFCNDLIWPLFHYFPSYSVFKQDYFEAYKVANQAFCDELLNVIRPGDFVWVHDYQLMLLPQMLRQRIPDATIGFFLHIPFPSFEVFRLIPRPWREAMINGLLGADMVGFHTNDYAQYFVKSVKRTTGCECRQNVIYNHGKMLKADAFPIGIDYDKFHAACVSPAAKAEKLKIKELINNQKLIFSVDRLDYSKGLLLRLNGFETFLEKYRHWHTKVVFNMVVVPSRDTIDKYKERKKEIESTVGRINGKYSTLAWRPIVYQYKSLNFHEMVALYDMSDVGLITPLRDGMNLVAKEYVACQIDNEGVLILSEMAGAAAELSEALIINPADSNEMSDAILTALEMPPAEKHARLERMKQRISNYNVFTWANDFFDQTYEMKMKQKELGIRVMNDSVSRGIISEYTRSQHRFFFLDYDGTLVSFTKYPEQAIISPATLEILKRLAASPGNHIVIISGRDRNFLDQQFAGIPVTLVAEHGYFIKPNGGKWEEQVHADTNWKSSVMPILEEYVSRCNGTFIEEKTGSLAWHYRNADSDFAQLRLNELRDDLSEIIRQKTQFEILEGNKVLEIKSGRYDKGQAALTILHEQPHDFILAAGDDKTDEFLFRSLPATAHTIRVGLNPSVAKYNVADNTPLLELLEKMGRE